jgi:hypothetical protein
MLIYLEKNATSAQYIANLIQTRHLIDVGATSDPPRTQISNRALATLGPTSNNHDLYPQSCRRLTEIAHTSSSRRHAEHYLLPTSRRARPAGHAAATPPAGVAGGPPNAL